MVSVCGSTSSVHYSITARPNCSLAWNNCVYVFSIAALFTLCISLIFAILGAWPVLFFSIAELFILAWAFCEVWRHARDYERLTIDGDNLVLEQHDNSHDKRVELNSYWARVVMECSPDGYCRRLALRSHGREIEFGQHMNGEERFALGMQLRDRLGVSQAGVLQI
ncbi:MAG TPA: DUF2244 domain-containing protein [Methylophilaceae bacterium]|nr:DUF2244 domain-containing protein [Methylophilaceae bacterium]